MWYHGNNNIPSAGIGAAPSTPGTSTYSSPTDTNQLPSTEAVGEIKDVGISIDTLNVEDIKSKTIEKSSWSHPWALIDLLIIWDVEICEEFEQETKMRNNKIVIL